MVEASSRVPAALPGPPYGVGAGPPYPHPPADSTRSKKKSRAHPLSGSLSPEVVWQEERGTTTWREGARLGRAEATLHNWRRRARERGELLPDAGVEAEGWSTRDKFAAVVETAAMNELERSCLNSHRALLTGRWS